MAPRLTHIITPAAWAAARAGGSHEPPSLAAEGFIHFSTPEQLLATAARHYRGAGALLVLGVDPDRLTAELRWDDVPALRQAFPHVYGPLNTDAVVAVATLVESAGGFELGRWQDI